VGTGLSERDGDAQQDDDSANNHLKGDFFVDQQPG
jgi:hypothetical protein